MGAELSRPSAVRLAPLALVLALVHPVVVQWFTLWAIDGLLHCDREGVHCGLGAAIHLLIPGVVGVAVAVLCIPIGLTARPENRRMAWFVLLAPTGVTWLVAGWMLAITPL
jgi:hypothetical protein